ncbi:uncharacterized protein [Diadema setosum]|uniref:uncharacterized protein n=1 Tax=Diadema setosum TaxID=31175 RepID=UPI003B3A7A3C
MFPFRVFVLLLVATLWAHLLSTSVGVRLGAISGQERKEPEFRTERDQSVPSAIPQGSRDFLSLSQGYDGKHSVSKRSYHSNAKFLIDRDADSCNYTRKESSGNFTYELFDGMTKCSQNRTIPAGFLIQIRSKDRLGFITQLRFGEFENAGNGSCLHDEVRLARPDFLDQPPTDKVLCNMTYTFPNDSNQALIEVVYKPNEDTNTSAWYSVEDEHNIMFYTEETPSGNTYGTYIEEDAHVFAELVTTDDDELSEESGDECIEVEGTMIRSRNIPDNEATCSWSYSPEDDLDVTLTFLVIDLMVPIGTECKDAHAFISIRTWDAAGYDAESVVCTDQSVGRQFVSSARIILTYHPSSLVRRGFIAELRTQTDTDNDLSTTDAYYPSTLARRGFIAELKAETTETNTDNDISTTGAYHSSSLVRRGYIAELKTETAETTARNDVPTTDAYFSDEDEDIEPWQQVNDSFPRQSTLVHHLKAQAGTFSSVGYPENYPRVRMKWSINVGIGKKIRLVFLDIDIGFTPPAACTPATPKIILIYSPPTADSQHYCGTFPPRNVTSTGHIFAVTFSPRAGPLIGRGISVEYTSFKDEITSFRSNVDNLDSLRISPTQLEPASPPTLTTRHIQVESKCRNLVANVTGTISSPGYPRGFASNQTSCWEIRSDASDVIRLRFMKSNLNSTQTNPCNLQLAYVSLTENNQSTQINCGSVNTTFISSTNHLRVDFKSVRSQGPGFLIEFDSMPREANQTRSPVCNASRDIESRIERGEAFAPALMSRCMWLDGSWPEWYTQSHKESEWFASPSFPDYYPPASHCVWIIRGVEGSSVAIRFKNFDLGEGDFEDCSLVKTFLRIRDCGTGIHQTLCSGRTVPEDQVIPFHVVYIEFIGEQAKGQGFQAYYEFKYIGSEEYTGRIPPKLMPRPEYRRHQLTPRPEPHSPSSTSIYRDYTVPSIGNVDITTDSMCKSAGSDVCGDHFQSEYGYFSSRNYPKEFPMENHCRWEISSNDTTKMIAVKFLDIDLGVPPSTGPCDTRYSFLEISISGDTRILCDTQGPNIFTAMSGVVSVEFSSLYSSGRGFCAAFTTVQSTFNGSLADLQFPCVCEDVYTNVTWGADNENPETATEPETCQFLLTDTSGTFPRDDFPSPYPPNYECIWTLLVESGMYIHLEFIRLDVDAPLGKEKQCLLSDTHVQVTLFDGDNVHQRRICSEDDASVPLPSATTAIIKFKSKDLSSHNHTGFQMSYSVDPTRRSFPGLRGNYSASNSSEDDFGFRVFDDYDFPLLSSVQSEDYESMYDTDRKENPNERPRLTLVIDDFTTIADYVTDIITDIVTDDDATTLEDKGPEWRKVPSDSARYFDGVVSTGSMSPPDPRPPSTTKKADLTTRSQNLQRASKTQPTMETPTTTTETMQTTTKYVSREDNEEIPGKGRRMTDKQIGLTIYISTGVAAVLILSLIFLILYCAKNRKRRGKADYDVDAADEANYWQTYKDWARDWATEPVGSALSTRDAVHGDDSFSAGKQPTGDMAEEDAGHLKTVSAVVNAPHVDKPPRSFDDPERLV